MNTKTNISKCGFYCHLCPAYIGQSGTPEDRLNGSAVWQRCFGLHFKPENMQCQSCQAPEPWKTGNNLPSKMCGIRACVIHNKISNCAYCSEFPCPQYKALTPGADCREKQEKKLGTTFTDSEYRAGIEPYEGIPHLIKIRESMQPGQIKTPEPIAKENKAVGFPDRTTLKSADEKTLRVLHSTLSALFSQTAPTYIEQILLERRLPIAFALLWSLALYGKNCKDYLVIDSSECLDKKECNRFVRKTDNKLHAAVQEAADKLKESGFVVEFTPRKKGWQLSLRAEASTGGKPALESLQYYVKSLSAKYGEPVYVDSYNLKGKAFKLFTRQDIQIFKA